MTGNHESATSTALITLCSASDLERFRLLKESVERFVPAHVPHYIIVDRRHEPQFREFNAGRSTVLRVEDVLPRWILRVPGARRWWLSLKSAPIRNWFLQQLVKLSIPNHVSQELLVFADSDVTLIRPFDPAAYLRDGKTRLLSVPGANDTNHTRWHQTAGKLLGLEPKDYYGASYIGNLVPWRRDNVLRLHQHIESVSGKPWLETICRHWHLSEYILYGVFAEQVLRETSGHYPDSTLNCLGHWDQDPLSESQVRDFLSGIKDHHVAIMISSKAQFPPNRLAKCIQELELAPSTTPARPSVAPSVR